jgi:UDP:flavonoid glycosyltransferase YjiC (YdhE family)
MSLIEGLVAKSKNENTNQHDICLVTFSFFAEKYESRCRDLGVRVVGMSIGEGFESEEAVQNRQKGTVIFPELADRSKPLLEEALDNFRPDVVVSDFCCHASQAYAATRNIPLVINWPGPFDTVWGILRPVVNATDETWYFSYGGLFVSYMRSTAVGAVICFNGMGFGTFANRIRDAINCGNSVVLVNSFWGFESPRYLFHPNIVPVGSVDKALPTSPDFSTSHPDLHVFLRNARDDHRKILLVTTGSMVTMEEWMVILLWDAFKSLARDHSVSIVWSLKKERQEFLSEEQLGHPAFHFSTWLPQPALLASDLVDGVLTHCGWNGTTECVAGGKPVVVLPFFVDQMTNARLLIKAGCATSVASIPAFNIDSTGRSSYAPPTNEDLGYSLKDLRERFRRLHLSRPTVDGIVEGCARLLLDPRYLRAAQKLKAIGAGPGLGRGFACDVIEHAGFHGLTHLTESGRTKGEDDDGPRPATHANRLTGHRPLVITMVGCASVVWAGTAIAIRIRRR